jgi:hypothetical protein
MEATAGIEPAYTDLQSAASPLRHVAHEVVQPILANQRHFTLAYIGMERNRQSPRLACLLLIVASKKRAFLLACPNLPEDRDD